MPRFRSRGSSGNRLEASSIDAYQQGGGRYVRKPIDAEKVDRPTGVDAKVAVLKEHQQKKSHPYFGLKELTHQSLVQTRDQLLTEAVREGEVQVKRPLQERAVGEGSTAAAFIRFQDQLRDIRADESSIANVLGTFGRSSLALSKQPSGSATLAWLGSEFAENLLSRIHADDKKNSNGEHAERAVSGIFAHQAAQLLATGKLTQAGFDALMAGFAAGMRGLSGQEITRTATPSQGEARQVSRLALAESRQGHAAREGLDSVLDTANKSPNTGSTHHALETAARVQTLADLVAELESVWHTGHTAPNPAAVEIPLADHKHASPPDGTGSPPVHVQSKLEPQSPRSRPEPAAVPSTGKPPNTTDQELAALREKILKQVQEAVSEGTAPLAHKKQLEALRQQLLAAIEELKARSKPANGKAEADELRVRLDALSTQIQQLEEALADLAVMARLSPRESGPADSGNEAVPSQPDRDSKRAVATDEATMQRAEEERQIDQEIIEANRELAELDAALARAGKVPPARQEATSQPEVLNPVRVDQDVGNTETVADQEALDTRTHLPPLSPQVRKLMLESGIDPDKASLEDRKAFDLLAQEVELAEQEQRLVEDEASLEAAQDEPQSSIDPGTSMDAPVMPTPPHGQGPDDDHEIDALGADQGDPPPGAVEPDTPEDWSGRDYKSGSPGARVNLPPAQAEQSRPSIMDDEGTDQPIENAQPSAQPTPGSQNSRRFQPPSTRALKEAAFAAGKNLAKIIRDGALNRATLRARLIDIVDGQVFQEKENASARDAAFQGEGPLMRAMFEPEWTQSEQAVRDSLFAGIVNSVPEGPGRDTLASVLIAAQLKLQDKGSDPEAAYVGALLGQLESLAAGDDAWKDALANARGELARRKLAATRPSIEPDERSVLAELAKSLRQRLEPITSADGLDAEREADSLGTAFAGHLDMLEEGEQAALLLEFLTIVAKVPTLHGDSLAGIAGPRTVYQALVDPILDVVSGDVIDTVLAGAIEASDRQGDWNVLDGAAYLAARMPRERLVEGQQMGPAERMILALEASKAGRDEAYQDAADRAISTLSSRIELVRESGLIPHSDSDEAIDEAQDPSQPDEHTAPDPIDAGIAVAKELGLDLPDEAINIEGLQDYFHRLMTAGGDEDARAGFLRGLAESVNGAALVAFTLATLHFTRENASLDPKRLRSFDAIFDSVEERLGLTLETGFGSSAVDTLKKEIGAWRRSMSIDDEPASTVDDQAPVPLVSPGTGVVMPAVDPQDENASRVARQNQPPVQPRWWFAPGEDPLAFDADADADAEDVSSAESTAKPAETHTEPEPVPVESRPPTIEARSPLDEALGDLLDPFEKATVQGIHMGPAAAVEPLQEASPGEADALAQAPAVRATGPASRRPRSPTEELLGQIANAEPGSYSALVARIGEFIASRADRLKTAEVDAIAQAVAGRFPENPQRVVTDLSRSILESTPPQLMAINDHSNRDAQRAASMACQRAAAWALRLMLSRGAALNEKLQEKFLDFAFANTSRSEKFVQRVGYQMEALGTAATVVLDRRNLINYNGSIANLQKLVIGRAASNVTVPAQKEQLKSIVRSSIIRGLNPDLTRGDAAQLLSLLRREGSAGANSRPGESKSR